MNIFFQCLTHIYQIAVSLIGNFNFSRYAFSQFQPLWDGFALDETIGHNWSHPSAQQVFEFVPLIGYWNGPTGLRFRKCHKINVWSIVFWGPEAPKWRPMLTKWLIREERHKNAALGKFLGSEVIRWRSKNWTVFIETEDWKISQRRWVELETLLIQPKNSIKYAKKS